MADDPNDTQDPPAKGDPDPKPDDTLGDAGKKALEAERKARRDAEKQLRDTQAQLKDLTDKDKSEVEKLREQVASLTKERDEHQSKVLRHEVAMEKGLTPAQAKRLVGGTKEELEADADEILEAFPVNNPSPPPGRKPAPHLKGGTDPTDEPEDLDPAKLAEGVARF